MYIKIRCLPQIALVVVTNSKGSVHPYYKAEECVFWVCPPKWTHKMGILEADGSDKHSSSGGCMNGGAHEEGAPTEMLMFLNLLLIAGRKKAETMQFNQQHNIRIKSTLL